MNDEVKKEAIELTDEEAAKVDGGSGNEASPVIQCWNCGQWYDKSKLAVCPYCGSLPDY